MITTEMLASLVVAWEAAAEKGCKDGDEWQALSFALELVDVTPAPEAREAEVVQQGPDYIGATADGDLVVWGRDGGVGWRYIEII
jgi:hypothetical protein